ncbi:hypothetical protein ACFWA9_20550 [Kitasatospora sp. NPDC059973]|uniref:hypothetical protein n=1 Tax=unclassified Kitasatospora TaxID=2633591 RepID=UPI0033203A69
MPSSPHPTDPRRVTPDRAAVSGEHWWPVVLAVAVVAMLHVTLPARYRVDPAWVLPVAVGSLLAVLIIGDPGRIDRQKAWLRVVTQLLIGAITVANVFAGVHLVVDILTDNKLFANNAVGLLATGGVVWVTNVVAFALWYWSLDRGGAAARAHRPFANPAFVFPEMQYPDHAPAAWVPRFADYLTLSFWTATAFSPTDVSAVRRWAKLLMMAQAATSLALGALVVARAINILQ